MKQLRDNKAQGSALFTLVSGIVIVIAVIFFLIKLAGSGSFGDVNETTEAATQTRIQPVGQLKMGDGIPVGERQGDQSFQQNLYPMSRGGQALFLTRLNSKTKAIGLLVSPKALIPCSNTL